MALLPNQNCFIVLVFHYFYFYKQGTLGNLMKCVAAACLFLPLCNMQLRDSTGTHSADVLSWAVQVASVVLLLLGAVSTLNMFPFVHTLKVSLGYMRSCTL